MVFKTRELPQRDLHDVSYAVRSNVREQTRPARFVPLRHKLVGLGVHSDE